MLNRLENLSNEILLIILSKLTSFEIIESFWSLNKRFNSLIYSTFSINSNEIQINEIGLSINKFQSIMSTIISDSSLSTSIKRIHIDGSKSIFLNLISQWIFQDNKFIHFVNLKSFTLRRCHLSDILINTLSLLIQYQLHEFNFTFDIDTFEVLHHLEDSCTNDRNY
ncbi:unnamed protein product, partial [Rotaria sp. Silwood2]